MLMKKADICQLHNCLHRSSLEGVARIDKTVEI